MKVLLALSVIVLATAAHVAPTMLHRWRTSVATSWPRKPARAEGRSQVGHFQAQGFINCMMGSPG
jgi:hypothetical protein